MLKITGKDPPSPLLSAGPIIACCWEDGAMWSSSLCRLMRSLPFRYQESQWESVEEWVALCRGWACLLMNFMVWQSKSCLLGKYYP